MTLASCIRRRRRRRPRRGDEVAELGQRPNGARNGLPLYLSGASKGFARNFGSLNARSDRQTSTNEPENELQEEQELPVIAGEGVTTHAVAHGLSLSGRTDATFDGGTFATENVQARRGQGCRGCSGNQCVSVTGELVSTFSVSTTVTLPSVNDFPNLTPCQRQRVQDAITNVLAPHEQQHVSAFHTYDGTVRQPFSFTTCRATFNDRIQSTHNTLAHQREASARSQSDALDPFNFEVDLNCQDTPGSSTTPSPSKQSASATGEETEGTGTDVG